MNFSTDFLLHSAQAVGLGLAVSALLWLFRRQASVRRVRVSLFLCAVSIGVYLVLTGLGLAAETLFTRFVLAAGIMFGANALLQLFDWLVWEYALGQNRHIIVPRLLVDVFNFVALAATALAMLNGVFGVNLNALLVTSTVVSAVIGLSLQDLLGSLVAGLALQLEQPFRVGDWVVVSGQEGQVIQMNWLLCVFYQPGHIQFKVDGDGFILQHVNSCYDIFNNFTFDKKLFSRLLGRLRWSIHPF